MEKSFDCHGAVGAYTLVIKCVITFVYFNCLGFLYYHLGTSVMCSKCFPFLYNVFQIKGQLAPRVAFLIKYKEMAMVGGVGIL